MAKPTHPITTPKGSSVLTLILAVTGVFTPFFASLEGALILAVVLALVIVWIYSGEIKAVATKKARPNVLALPGFAILIIAGVASFATWSVDSKPKTASAITTQDISALLDRALAQRQAPQQLAMPNAPTATPDHNVTYRVVIAEPSQRISPPVPRPSPQSTFDVGEFSRKIKESSARRKVSWDAELKCSNDNQALTMGLFAIDVKAVDYLNEFVYGKNDRNMISHLDAWKNSVREFYNSHKDRLPDIIAFEVAKGGRVQSGFLGIHAAGAQAWGEMEAKRKVLNALSDEITRRSCETVGKAALAECIEQGKCG